MIMRVDRLFSGRIPLTIMTWGRVNDAWDEMEHWQGLTC